MTQPIIEQPREAEPVEGWEDDPSSCPFCSSTSYDSSWAETDHDSNEISEYYLHTCRRCGAEWQVREIYEYTHMESVDIQYTPMIDPNDLRYHTEK